MKDTRPIRFTGCGGWPSEGRFLAGELRDPRTCMSFLHDEAIGRNPYGRWLASQPEGWLIGHEMTGAQYGAMPSWRREVWQGLLASLQEIGTQVSIYLSAQRSARWDACSNQDMSERRPFDTSRADDRSVLRCQIRPWRLYGADLALLDVGGTPMGVQAAEWVRSNIGIDCGVEGPGELPNGLPDWSMLDRVPCCHTLWWHRLRASQANVSTYPHECIVLITDVFGQQGPLPTQDELNWIVERGFCLAVSRRGPGTPDGYPAWDDMVAAAYAAAGVQT